MNDRPRHTLKKLVIEHGLELASDPRRTEAFLKDLCPTDRTEIFVLIHAQRERVPAELLTAPAWMPQPALWARLSKRLQQNLAFNPDAADWAVESWAFVLDQTPGRADRFWLWLSNLKRSNETGAGASEIDSLAAASASGGQSVASGVQSTHEQRNQIESRSAVAAHRQWDVQTQDPRRSRLRCLGSWVATAAAILLAGWLLIAVIAPALPSLPDSLGFPFLSAGDQRGAASDIYPLPRPAWVWSPELIVRAETSAGSAPVYRLPSATQVTLEEFTPDLRWARITEPAEGWVDVQELILRTDDEPAVNVFLQPGGLRVTGIDLNVRQGPGTSYDVVDQVHREDRLETVAMTTDGEWRQIVAPTPGWVSVDFVSPIIDE